MSETHLHGQFYRCDDCEETFDAKGSEHRCEGSREDVLAMLEEARETIDSQRVALDVAKGIVGTEPITAMSPAPSIDQLRALQDALRDAGVLT